MCFQSQDRKSFFPHFHISGHWGKCIADGFCSDHYAPAPAPAPPHMSAPNPSAPVSAPAPASAPIFAPSPTPAPSSLSPAPGK